MHACQRHEKADMDIGKGQKVLITILGKDLKTQASAFRNKSKSLTLRYKLLMYDYNLGPGDINISITTGMMSHRDLLDIALLRLTVSWSDMNFLTFEQNPSIQIAVKKRNSTCQK